MSDEKNNEPNSSGENGAKDGAMETGHTNVSIQYANQSRMILDEPMPRLALFGNLQRDPVYLDGVIKEPIRFREAMAALYAVVGSDYRYVPKDRTAYHAFRRMRNESANMGAWQAQHAHFDWLSRNDPLAYLILDPVISVHPDKVFFEVFSKDEGTYANLSVNMDAFELNGQPAYGTTNIDFSENLYNSVQQFRSYRKTRLTIGQQAVAVQTEGKPDVLEKQIRVPDSWIRGFLQVQSSTTLANDTFSIAAIDLYNTLRHLRMHADQKGKRRGLRVELIPGEKPRIVLEPWETVLECSSGTYQGRQPKVVRIWGRRRLMLLQRMLPFVDEVDVHLIGSGLPSFWILKSKSITFTIGMTGFTAANWSQAVNFDLLLPRKTQDAEPLERVVKILSQRWSASEINLAQESDLQGESLVEPLQLGCQQGQVMFDVADKVFRIRPLTNEPLDFNRLEFRSRNERVAHDLVHRQNAIQISKENRIFGTGIEITGKADVKEDRREYLPQILINDEGFVSKAECTCTHFRKQGLKAGPCAHLVALRLAHAVREKQRGEAGQAQTVTVETRTYTRRKNNKEEVYQISLDEKQLKVRWGHQGENLRVQQLRFSNTDDARTEYFSRLNQLSVKGFLDATAG